MLDTAHEPGMRTHMDGARLMNAVVASGVPAREMVGEMRFRLARFHQGPGCAAGRGAVRLARSSSTRPGAGSSGSAARCARRGICAAACIYALDHNIDRLAEDHANAGCWRAGLAQIAGHRGGGAGNQPGVLRYHGHRPDRR